jgi:A/G-specific adenine glycosylase
MTTFAESVLAWYDVHGRRNLPWQHPRTPYRVWISEVMLQQTQVATVIPYFERFVARFPNIATLARAEIDDVLHLWTGLGYYARGRNLHAAAKRIVAEFTAELPDSLEALVSLPGIGRSTAGAILSAGHGIRAPILDGNVKRVLARHFAVDGYPGETSVAKVLWEHANATTPNDRPADYTQAIMDLGATLRTRTNPRCNECPVLSSCSAFAADVVDRLPSPRPKKMLPIRRARMFLIIDADGYCLLERRSPTGLWGGLWNPPERPDQRSPSDLLEELGVRESDVSEKHHMPTFRHTFTHFHLDIEPFRIELTNRPLAIADADRWRWYGVGNNEAFGLSAVAVRLLTLTKPLELT